MIRLDVVHSHSAPTRSQCCHRNVSEPDSFLDQSSDARVLAEQVSGFIVPAFFPVAGEFASNLPSNLVLNSRECWRSVGNIPGTL